MISLLGRNIVHFESTLSIIVSLLFIVYLLLRIRDKL